MGVSDYLQVVASNLRRAAQEATSMANTARSQIITHEKEINDHISKLKKEILALEVALAAHMQREETTIKNNLLRGIRKLQKEIDDKQQEIKAEKERLEQQARFMEQEISRFNEEASSYERRVGEHS